MNIDLIQEMRRGLSEFKAANQPYKKNQVDLLHKKENL